MWQHACGDHTTGSDSRIRVSQWFTEKEEVHSCVVCQCDHRPENWNQTAMQQADVVLYVAMPAAGGPDTSAVSRSNAELPNGIRRELVLLRCGPHSPSGTAAWLASADYITHHHVDLAATADYRRLIRRARRRLGFGSQRGRGARTGASRRDPRHHRPRTADRHDWRNQHGRHHRRSVCKRSRTRSGAERSSQGIRIGTESLGFHGAVCLPSQRSINQSKAAADVWRSADRGLSGQLLLRLL